MINQGIVTGQLGYTLRREYLGTDIPFKRIENLSYELYSVDFSTNNSSGIQRGILNDFTNRFSGDISVKVFQTPGDYTFPNDNIRAAKYNVSVEVRSVEGQFGAGGTLPELGSSWYNAYASLYSSSGAGFKDFQDSFTFDKGENGSIEISHDLSFSLVSGNRSFAQSFASGWFDYDKGLYLNSYSNEVFNPSLFRNLYSETYDTLRGTYKFSRHATKLKDDVTTGLMTLTHVLDVKEDGTTEVTERGEVLGKVSYAQSKSVSDYYSATAYSRCSPFYTQYLGVGSELAVAGTLVNLPVRVQRNLNRQTMRTDYEVIFTDNPQWSTSGIMREDVMDITSDVSLNVDLKHSATFTRNKRSSNSTTFQDKLATFSGESPTMASAYYSSSQLGLAGRSLKQVKWNAEWPNHKNRATFTYEYSDNPRYNVSIQGTTFRYLDVKLTNSQPVDMITEYKIINRPQQTSVVNYAYQTDKGQITVDLEAGLGKNADEFYTGFRAIPNAALNSLFKHGITVFLGYFNNVMPVNFTYFLSDSKYTVSEEGIITMNLIFTYTIKKYTM